jgi:hypothetical protein
MRGSELSSAPGAVLGRIPSSGALAARLGNWLVDGITGAATPGSPAGSALDRVLRVPWQSAVAFTIFAIALQRSVDAEIARGYPMAWLALLAIPVGLFLLRRPLLLALVMAMAGTYLRALYLSAPETCDQLAVSRAALGVAMGGGNPYGIGYAESVPAGSPFPYGPLAMLSSLGGIPGEVLAVTGIMLILAFSRALITLAVLAAWVPAIEFGVCGLNDQVPAFLLLAGLLLIERRDRVSGAVLMALSAGIKPYTFAWFPGMMAVGGTVVTAVLACVSLVAWLPALLWGPASYLHSIELALATHPEPANTLNMPQWRIVAVPIALAALMVRSWTTAVLSGALIFLAVLFLDWWASVGYWFVVMPVVGIVGERALVRFGAELRATRRQELVAA